MKITTLAELVQMSLDAQTHFRDHWAHYSPDPSLSVDSTKARRILTQLEERLNDNYPFFHPRYAGQMIKPPHEIAIAAYLMAMQINPNNHALDGGPATAKMELETVESIAAMFGYDKCLGHLTSSGTIANLEALWVAKSIHPDKSIAYSVNAHYTHGRMCSVLSAKSVCLESFEHFEEAITKHNIGTVVVTIGTTSTGEIEPLDKILPIARKHNVRVHVDAAYGGFFMLLAKRSTPIVDPTSFLAIKDCDSIVVDPHKHALQPYGCGCVLFKDPSVGKFYKHDSPYTYFTSSDLHLGEISLECSRAGASAAALWATLQYFPLTVDGGFSSLLEKTRNAAMNFYGFIEQSHTMAEYKKPDLDIVTFFPKTKRFSASAVSTTVQDIFFELMNRTTNPVYLAALHVRSDDITQQYPDFINDQPTTKIFRCVLMKPEHESYAHTIFKEIEQLVDQ